MFKNNLIYSAKLTIRLMLIVICIFLLVLFINFLSGGIEAACSYVQSIKVRGVLAPVFSVFIVTLFLPSLVMLFLSKFNFRISLQKNKKNRQ